MDLWKKESNKPGALYVNIFKNMEAEYPDDVANMDQLPILLQNIAGLKIVSKSDLKAAEFRAQGNAQFKQNKIIDAMNSYNKSLCFAEIRSENVSLVYGNRSACFFHLKRYNECLVDIELAMQANYPQRLMEKLEQRREACLKAIKATTVSAESEPKLSYEEDPNFPGMANVLKIEYNPQYGRHIVAKSDIPAGKIVMVDQSLITLDKEKKFGDCIICMKKFANLIACDDCSSAMFCTACVDKNIFHKLECNNLVNTHSDAEFVARIISFAVHTFADFDSWMTFVENAVAHKANAAPDSMKDSLSKYHAFLQLNIFLSTERWNEDILPAYKGFRIMSMYKSLQARLDTEKKKRFFMHLCFHHVLVLGCNIFKERDDFSGNIKNIFILQSYFNHSCTPNVMAGGVQGNRSTISTIRPIKKGQQLLVSYSGDLYGVRSVDYYQKYLFDKFGFRCECEKCKPKKREMDSSELTIEADQDFQNLLKISNKKAECNFDKSTAKIMHEKCIVLLNRYGHMHWCEAIGYIMQYCSVIDKEFKIR